MRTDHRYKDSTLRRTCADLGLETTHNHQPVLERFASLLKGLCKSHVVAVSTFIGTRSGRSNPDGVEGQLLGVSFWHRLLCLSSGFPRSRE